MSPSRAHPTIKHTALAKSARTRKIKAQDLPRSQQKRHFPMGFIHPDVQQSRSQYSVRHHKDTKRKVASRQGASTTNTFIVGTNALPFASGLSIVPDEEGIAQVK